MAADSIAKRRYEKEEMTTFILSSAFKLLSQNFSYNQQGSTRTIMY